MVYHNVMCSKYLTLCLFPFIIVAASAKAPIDCRVATSGMSKCNPYSSKFLVAKEIEYKKDQKKLIISKTLPVPKKSSVKVISVIDMIEKYVKIEKSIRYEGSKDRHLESLNIESPEDKNDHSLSEEMDIRREATLKKLQQMEDEAYSKRTKETVCVPSTEVAEKVQPLEEQEQKEEVTQVEEEKQVIEGFYAVESGDTLSTIAQKFSLKTSTLRALNDLEKGDTLKIGKKLKIPMEQVRVDIIAKAEYIIQSGDNVGSIAQDFNLSSSDIFKYNRLKKTSTICIGKKLILPFPYKIAKLEKERKAREAKERTKAKKSRMVKGFGKRKLRVTATAYSSHSSQTDKTPFLAAWNNRIRPGMKIIAVSRDMLTTYGLRNGSKVRIGGLSGFYTVRDKMNKRYRKRIDIYMGTNRRRALRWGRRSVILYY